MNMFVCQEQEDKRWPKQHHHSLSRRPTLFLLRLLLLLLLSALVMLALSSFLTGSATYINTLKSDLHLSETKTKFLPEAKSVSSQSPFLADAPPPLTKSKTKPVNKVDTIVELGPYHNWQLFIQDFEEMMRSFKIYVYPEAFMNQSHSQFAPIFLPHPNPFNPRLGNYFSEHMFKLSLLRSSLITSQPQQAHLFFLPFSINLLRNDPRVHSEQSISEFVSQYTTKISHDFTFWNASAGADHFYVYCHSVGREASSKVQDLHNNAIQVTCSSSYFQRYYATHKDVALPQVWPRPHGEPLTPPDARHKLVYFSGRIQNSRIRQELIALWGNDSYMDVFSRSPFPYEEGFKRSKYCLHVKGYEVNTARIGCIVWPVTLRPPTTGFIKINVDAAVSQSRTTLAAVARNDKGEVLGIWAKADCVEEHEVAEAKAVLWALQMAMEEDYNRVIVEGDAKGITDPLQQPLNPVNWTISSILGDVHSIAAYFLNCNSQWIRRGGNNLALIIAKFASSLSYFLCNAENIPQVILQAWQLDVLSFSIQ